MLKAVHFTYILVPIVGIAMFAAFSEVTVDQVGEELAQKLVEILPEKQCSAAQKGDEALPELTRKSSMDPAGPYNAQKAMERRLEGLRETCMKYSDFMRPENMMTGVRVDQSNWLINGKSQTAFCGLPKVAHKALTTLFNRLREPSMEEENKLKYFKANYPQCMKDFKKAIMVRHPLERLISVYRNTYEKTYNPVSGQEEGGEIEWVDFIYIILNGPIEYAEFVIANSLEPGSVAIDTGMIDGQGASKAWAPYWMHCGLCNPVYTPDFILHLEHVREDVQTLLDAMQMPADKYKGWLDVHVTPKATIREVEEHYYGQLKKSEIRELYDKYKQDHEMFGYSPDYYIQLGQDD